MARRGPIPVTGSRPCQRAGMYLRLSIGALLLASASIPAIQNGVARTPPMGWNTFNAWGGEWDDARIKGAADALVSTGLRDCGYIYCNMDGNDNGLTPYWPGWPGFVAWAKPLADYMHARGLKCGVYIAYTDTMSATARDLIAAGIDFLKQDEYWLETTDPKWRTNLNTLLASGWNGVYSIHAGYNTGDSSLCHMWRTGDDIQANWSTVMTNYDSNYWVLQNTGPGGWADPDMLETGVMGNLTEGRSHFSMWCMMAAPLLIGYDITRTNASNFAQIIAILSNAELIAVDQDRLGKPGRRVRTTNQVEVWVRDMSDGTKAVALFNRGGGSTSASVTQADLGLSSASSIYVRDLWLHQDQPQFTGTFTKSVASHAAEVYRMSDGPIPSTDIVRRMDRSVKYLESIGYEVFPRRLMPGVMQGTGVQARVFDLRGKLLAVDPRLAGAGTYILRLDATEKAVAKVVWPGVGPAAGD